MERLRMSLSATSAILVRSMHCSTAALRCSRGRPFSSAAKARYSRGVISVYSGGCSGR